MYKFRGNYYILVPRKWIRDKWDNQEKRTGLLMSYCWLVRFGTQDGYYSSSMQEISEKLGLNYNKDKDRHIPKAVQDFQTGLDYLYEIGALKILNGSYYNFEEKVDYKLNVDFFEKEPYVLLNINYLDYILKIESRARKLNLLYVTLFILSCYTKKDNETYCACSYSIKYMRENMQFQESTLRNYLGLLSCKQEYPNEKKPFMSSKAFYIKLKNGRIIRFPNIYVENNQNSISIIEYQKSYLKKIFSMKRDNRPKEFSNMVDYDDLY